MKLNKLKQIIKEEIQKLQKLQTLNEVEVYSTEHTLSPEGDGIFCRYNYEYMGEDGEMYGGSSSFFLPGETSCPPSDEVDINPEASMGCNSGRPVMVKLPGVSAPVSVTTTLKPIRAQRPTRAPRVDKRPGSSRPMPVNPQPRGGVMSYMGPQAGGGLTGANAPGGPRTR